MTSHAVSRGRLTVTTGWQKICSWRASRVFWLDSCIVFIHFAYTQDHDFVLYWCWVPLALRGHLVFVCYHPNKGKTRRTLVEYGQL